MWWCLVAACCLFLGLQSRPGPLNVRSREWTDAEVSEESSRDLPGRWTEESDWSGRQYLDAASAEDQNDRQFANQAGDKTYDLLPSTYLEESQPVGGIYPQSATGSAGDQPAPGTVVDDSYPGAATEAVTEDDVNYEAAGYDSAYNRRRRSPEADAFDMGASYFSRFFDILDPGRKVEQAKGRSPDAPTFFVPTAPPPTQAATARADPLVSAAAGAANPTPPTRSEALNPLNNLQLTDFFNNPFASVGSGQTTTPPTRPSRSTLRPSGPAASTTTTSTPSSPATTSAPISRVPDILTSSLMPNNIFQPFQLPVFSSPSTDQPSSSTGQPIPSTLQPGSTVALPSPPSVPSSPPSVPPNSPSVPLTPLFVSPSPPSVPLSPPSTMPISVVQPPGAQPGPAVSSLPSSNDLPFTVSDFDRLFSSGSAQQATSTLASMMQNAAPSQQAAFSPQQGMPMGFQQAVAAIVSTAMPPASAQPQPPVQIPVQATLLPSPQQLVSSPAIPPSVQLPSVPLPAQPSVLPPAQLSSVPQPAQLQTDPPAARPPSGQQPGQPPTFASPVQLPSLLPLNQLPPPLVSFSQPPPFQPSSQPVVQAQPSPVVLPSSLPPTIQQQVQQTPSLGQQLGIQLPPLPPTSTPGIPSPPFLAQSGLGSMLATASAAGVQPSRGSRDFGGPDLMLPPFELPLTALPWESCHTQSGDMGDCLSRVACEAQNGVSSGPCHQGLDSATEERTCCIFPSYCGYETNKEVTYFQSPGYPNTTTSEGDYCIFRVNLLPGVCQLRIDFLDFAMKPPVGGECEEANSMQLSSSDPTAVIPLTYICGNNSMMNPDPLRTDMPHLYVHVDRDIPPSQMIVRAPNKFNDPSVQLTFRVQDYQSRWQVRLSQIQCDGANLQAPMGCAQWYNMNSGTISSLNLQNGQYLKNLRLYSCIKRDPGACAVQYNIKYMGVGQVKGNAGRLGYGLTCQDYLLINGEKTAMCGSLTNTRSMVFPAKGTEALFLYTDSVFQDKADVGYQVEYTHLRDCQNVTFHKYPVAK